MKSLDQILDSFGHSEPDPAAVQAAQRKLEERIAQVAPKRRSRSVGGWLAAAASAAWRRPPRSPSATCRNTSATTTRCVSSSNSA
jgi:hypothetical protein